MKDNKNKKRELWLSLPFGAAAGFVNGFLGTGGGILLLMASPLIAKNEDPRDRFAETLAVTMVFSAVSALFYFKSNSALSIGVTSEYSSPALFGGALGAILLSLLPPKATKKIFSALVVVAGLIMILK